MITTRVTQASDQDNAQELLAAVFAVVDLAKLADFSRKLFTLFSGSERWS